MKKQSILITSLIFIVIVLSLVQVVLSNSLSTTGLDLYNIDNQVLAIKNENSSIREKLLSETSLTEIASKAAEEGYIAENSHVFVGSSIPVAVKP